VGLFIKNYIMSEEEKKVVKPKKEVKEFKVLKKSVGSSTTFKGEYIVLNNGLPQKTLKALFNAGFKCVTNE